MKLLLAYIILTVILVGFFYLSLNQLLRNSLSTQPVYSPGNSPLDLILKMNATKIIPGQGINITVELYYNGSSPLTLNTSGFYMLSYTLVISPCPCEHKYYITRLILWYLVSLRIFKGYYTLSNISKAKPLCLTETRVLTPIIVIPPIIKYILLPKSDEVLMNGTKFTDEISLTFYGYWVFPNSSTLAPLSNGNFTYFQPGIYTVVAFDYFNQTVFAYFTVV